MSVIDSSLTDNLGGGIYVRRWEGYENRLSKITITGNTLTRSGNIDVRSDNTAADAAPIQVKNNQVSGLTDTTEPYLLFDARTRPSNLTGNTASGNKVNAIMLGGTLVENWTMPTTGAPYVIAGSLSVPAGVTLTVAAGTVVKFRGGDLDVSGAVAVNGTAAAPVTFTSYQDDSAGGDTNGDGGASTPAAGGWGGISVTTAASLTATRLAQKFGSSGISANPGAGTVSVIDSSLTDNLGGGIYVRRWEGYENRLAKIIITGNTLTRSGNIDVRSDNTAADAAPILVKNNQVSGLTDTTEPYLLFDARTRPSNLTGNTASGNKVNAIMLGGTLVENWTMPTTGAPYVIAGSLSVPAGVTLTVAAGTVVKFRGGDLDVSGAVAVNGTAAAPVTFTSYQDDSAGGDTNGDGGASTPAAGGWGGISGNTAASLTATRLAQKFGSSGISANPGAGTVSVIDSSLTDNLGGGIYVRRWEGYENRLAKIIITGNTLTRSGNIDVRSDNTAADAAPILVKNNQVSGLTDTTEPYAVRCPDQAEQPHGEYGLREQGQRDHARRHPGRELDDAHDRRAQRDRRVVECSGGGDVDVCGRHGGEVPRRRS